MKNTFNLFVCFLFAFFWGSVAQAQSNVDFNILDQLIASNGDERDKPGGLGGSDGSGGGGSNMKIFTDWPNTSKMLSKPSRINWSTDDANGPFTVTIKDVRGNEVNTMETNESSVIVPFLRLNLDAGTYTIEVSAGDFISPTSTFTLVETSEYSNLMKELNNNPKFINADYFKRISMRAFALEVEGFNYDAYQFYKTYMFDDKDDMTLRNLRDRFRTEYKILD